MVLETIRQLYPSLTRSQRELADFVVHSYRDAAFMKASDLAAHMGLNEATVIRFAQRLGYRGYPELSQAIQELVQHELVAPPEAEDEQESQVLALLSTELEGAQRLLRGLAPDQVEEIVALLAGAETVYVLGQGMAYPFGMLLYEALRAIGHRAQLVPADPGALANLLHEAGPHDVLIGLSAGEAQGDLVAGALNVAREIPAATVAIACDPLAPCAQAARYALICPKPENTLLPPTTALAALIDALAHALGARHADRMRERQQSLGEMRLSLLASASRQ